MGDYYQTIAVLDVDVPAAAKLVQTIRDWMISQRIIAADLQDCVLSETLGHPPGENYVVAVSKPCPSLFELKTNGVQFIAGHTVFYSMGIGETTLICSACGERFRSNDAWSAAVADWHENNGPGTLRCERCGVAAAITEWRHAPPWAFGNVGIEFWNWPPLREDFLEKVSQLSQHRVRLIRGKF